MRLSKMVPWVGCVWFLGVTVGSGPGAPGHGLAVAPASAETKDGQAPPRKTPKKEKAAIYRCVDYSQDQDDEGMALHLSNRCNMDLSCSMSWELACQSDDDSYKGASVFLLEDATTNGAYVSAASCGDDGWQIRKVRWSCADDQAAP